MQRAQATCQLLAGNRYDDDGLMQIDFVRLGLNELIGPIILDDVDVNSDDLMGDIVT